MKYPGYQCFKVRGEATDQVYCSKSKMMNHALGATWIGKCLSNYNLRSSDIHGKPYVVNSQPDEAIIYPE